MYGSSRVAVYHVFSIHLFETNNNAKWIPEKKYEM